ncbi:translocase of outer mitochondrial membrane [Cryptotrichosporon argae]
MAFAQPNEKLPSPPALAPYLDAVSALLHPVSRPLAHQYSRFHGWKESLGLVQPGTLEALTRDVTNTNAANFSFEGARADLNKVVSANPAFQLSHSFSMGGAQKPSSYQLGAIFANASHFLHGQWEPATGNVNMRLNETWSPSDVTKVQAQLSQAAGNTMVQIEHDHLGPHYSLNLKTINLSPADLTGIHFVSLLHSFGPRLSLGFETIIQHPQPAILETQTAWLAKLTSLPSAAAALAPPAAPGQPAALPFQPSWTATAQLQATGNVQATYFHRLSDKVDVALDFNTVFQPASMMGPAKREAITTLGAKYDFRMATVRGQIDSNAKLAMVLEQRFTPAFAFLVSGEIDHKKNTSKFGLGVMIESSTMTPEEMMAAGMIAPA